MRHALALAVVASLAAPAAAEEAPPAPSDAPVDLSEAAPSPAAPKAQDDWPEWLDAHERRCGFAFGLQGGGVLGAAEGFPNDSLKIDRFAFFTETGVAGGGQGSGWVGIALTDWLVFGLEGHGGRIFSSDHRTHFFGGAFHIDLFPLYALGGAWKDIGVLFNAGVSLSNTQRADNAEEDVIESGGASRIAVGAFYEGIRLWKLSMGPFAAYDQIWSQSAFRPAGWLGWRTAFYASP